MNKKLFLVVRRIISTAAIIFLSIIIVASALTFQFVVYGTDNPKILVVQHSEQRFWFADTGLNQLGIPHDTIKISDLPNSDLTKYRIIIFGSQLGRLEEVKPYVDAKAPEIDSWITKGGCLAIFSQYVHAAVWDLPDNQLSMDQGSGYYKWLPGEPDFVSAAKDTIHITNNTHPITKNFTDYDLSFWDSSADGYFTNPPGETLAVQTGQADPYFPYLQPNAQNDHCVLYAQELGAGKIVASSLDADYHCLLYNGHANCNKQGAKDLFKAIINWFSEDESPTVAPITTNLSVSTSANSTQLGFILDINGILNDLHLQPLSGERILLSYSIPGFSTWNPITSVTTDAYGHYIASWIPAATGNFAVKAEWIGNQTHARAWDAKNISVLRGPSESLFFAESNSTISSLAFDSVTNQISFTVNGPSGTSGYTSMLFPKAFLSNPADLKVYVDGLQTEYSIASADENSWRIYFNYTHSSHGIVVSSHAQTIPEFPSWVVLPIAATIAVLSVVLLRKKIAPLRLKHSKHSNT